MTASDQVPSFRNLRNVPSEDMVVLFVFVIVNAPAEWLYY